MFSKRTRKAETKEKGINKKGSGEEKEKSTGGMIKVNIKVNINIFLFCNFLFFPSNFMKTA